MLVVLRVFFFQVPPATAFYTLSLHDALPIFWPAGLVIGVDRKDVLERAMVRHAIDVAADDPVVLAEADLVILAAPIQQNLELLRELPNHVGGSAVVTDTGSTKREIVEAARSLPDRLTFIGGHP